MGGTYFVRIPVSPDVARDLPPVMVLPLKKLREMLQKSEGEDCAWQSGAVDRLGARQPFHFDAMD